MLVYDISGKNLKKHHHKKVKSDLVSLVLRYGGCPVTFSEDDRIYVYEIPKEGTVIFNDHKTLVRVFLSLNEGSKTLNYFLSELDKIRKDYQ